MIRKPRTAAKNLYQRCSNFPESSYVSFHATILIALAVPLKSQAKGQTIAPRPPQRENLSYEDSRRFLLDHHDTLLRGGSYELTSLSEVQYGGESRDSKQRIEVDVDYDRNKGDAPGEMWNSFWLHSIVLVSFLAVFTAMFIATVVLYHFSEARHGLSTTISKNIYSWTYGPTARRFLRPFYALSQLMRYSAHYHR